MKTKKHFLTDREKEFIIQNRHKMFAEEMAEALKIKRHTIYQFLHREKLSYKRVQDYCKHFLTRSEEIVASLMAKGLSDEEIAKKLILSESTIRTHKIKIYSKCGATGSTARVKAVLYYLKEKGLLNEKHKLHTKTMD